MSNKVLGNYGEFLAERHLKALGYKILEKNYRNKLGEIDLVAQDGQTVCFVEVKTRQSLEQGRPLEAIHPGKVRKLTQLALSFLKHKYHSIDVPSRFDVVSIIQNSSGAPAVQHLKNAFDAIY